MGAMSRWSVRKPWQAVIVWVVGLLLIGGLASAFKGEFNDAFDLPDTESKVATDLLAADFPAAAQNQASILFSPETGTINEPAVKAEIDALIVQVSENPSVESVSSPYEPFAAERGLVSPDGTVGIVSLSLGSDFDVPVADVKALIADVEEVNSGPLTAGIAGQSIEFAATEPPKSEIFGIMLAIVIMLAMFASLVAAGLPILTALIGLGAGLGLVSLTARFMDVATFGPTLAAMIGLGVGIDYALFVINRYRQAVHVGREPKDAAMEAVNTSGRAVMFAGTAVVIALLGLFVLNINFMDGLAVAAALTVIMVMLTAVTLLPAVISLLGHKVFAVKMPWAKEEYHEGRRLASYATGLQKRPWVYAIVALVAMLALTIPTFSMRLGFPDSSGKPEGNTSRIAYDLTSLGFGPGANGPFLVVVEMPETNGIEAANELSAALATTPGVASASPVVPGTAAVSADGTKAIIQVIPTTGPQEEATSELLVTVREQTIPTVAAATGLSAYVGGATAVTSDFATVLSDALPAFLLVVVTLGFLALMLLFRSFVVPAIGALTALLSLGAALGATVAVFQWGHFANLFGVTATGPILPFLPVMLFAILFGLSMDYQVFLASRMQEEWTRTQDNRLSVRRGLIGSGRVVMAAAAIMFSVFISFVFGDDTTIKMFGLALAIAVALDAFVVRMVLVPALMTIIGKPNWYLPGWLNRMLPKIHVETEEEAAEIEDPLDEPTPVAERA